MYQNKYRTGKKILQNWLLPIPQYLFQDSVRIGCLYPIPISWMDTLPSFGCIPLQTTSFCRQYSFAETIPLQTPSLCYRYTTSLIQSLPATDMEKSEAIRAVAFVNLKPYGFIGQFLIVVLLAEMAQENLLKPVMEHAV